MSDYDYKIKRLWNWAFTDNGIKSADKRIQENTMRIDETFNGERRCAVGKSFDEYLSQMNKKTEKQWVLISGIILLVIGQGIELFFLFMVK